MFIVYVFALIGVLALGFACKAFVLDRIDSLERRFAECKRWNRYYQGGHVNPDMYKERICSLELQVEELNRQIFGNSYGCDLNDEEKQLYERVEELEQQILRDRKSEDASKE